MMSNPKSTSSHVDNVQRKDLSLNMGSSLSAELPEQSFLDAISNFNFVECHGLATAIELYRESATPQHLVATDIIDRMWHLAQVVISYSYLFTV